MKKTVVVLLLLLLVGGLVWTLVSIYKKHQAELSEELASDEQAAFDIGEESAYILTKKEPTDIIWIGEWDDSYEWEIAVRFETEITEQTLKRREGFKHTYIVINDLDGSIEISDEEYEILKSYLVNQEHFFFIYIGRDLMNQIVEKMSLSSSAIIDEDLSIALYNKQGRIGCMLGTYSEVMLREGVPAENAAIDFLGIFLK